MIAVILFGFLAAAAAAPHRHHHGPPPYHPEHRGDFAHYDPFADEIFDTRQFWAEMANEMRQLDELLASFSQRFPTKVSEYGIEGNEYKISIPLSGFDEKDIVVKAKEGFLMVQAVHKMEGGGERMYLDAKTLPTCVNVNGTWTFNEGVLKIVFPLKPEAVTEAPVTEETETTTRQVRDREEMDTNDNSDANDADVGLRGDSDKSVELFTNEISQNRVEATTYAVDLKDEVEFVPVKY